MLVLWAFSLFCFVFSLPSQEPLPRPVGLNTVSLLRAASNALNLGPKQTMKVAEELGVKVMRNAVAGFYQQVVNGWLLLIVE